MPRSSRPDASGRLYPSLVLTVCAPLGPDRIDARHPGMAPRRFERGDLAAGGRCSVAGSLGGRLAPLARMVDSARELDAGRPWLVPGAGRDRRRAGRAGPGLQRPAVAAARRLPAAATIQQRCLSPVANSADGPDRPDRGRPEARTLGRRISARPHVGRWARRTSSDRSSRLCCSSAGPTPTPSSPTCELLIWIAGSPNTWRPAATAAADASTFRAGGEPLGPGPSRRCSVSCSTTCWTTPANTAGRARRSSSRHVRDRDQAVLAVEDSGPGIPADELPRVFEPFYRSAPGRRPGVPGVGLGLAIVHRIATAFGGSVAVRSEPREGRDLRSDSR